MKCEDIRDRLMDVTAKDLTSTEPELRTHLNQCERCRQDLQRSEGIWALLAEIPEETPDWSGMRASFAEMLRDCQHTMEQATTHRRWLGALGRPWWRPAFAAAVIVAALVIGVVVGRQIPAGGRAPNQEVNAMRQELREVREMLTLTLMQQTLASDRIKGASWAAQMDNPRGDVLTALIDVLLHDSNVNVRLACLRALERFGEQSAVRQGIATALTAEHSPLVSIALIDFVAEANDKMAIDTLRELSLDPVRDRAVRERAAQAFIRLRKGGRG